jgi:hypothetical protein
MLLGLATHHDDKRMHMIRRLKDVPHRQGSTFVLSYFLHHAHAQRNLGSRINVTMAPIVMAPTAFVMGATSTPVDISIGLTLAASPRPYDVINSFKTAGTSVNDIPLSSSVEKKSIGTTSFAHSSTIFAVLTRADFIGRRD